MSPRRVKITLGDVSVTAQLNSSATADQVWNALPIKSRVSTWGDEVYFSTSVAASESKEATDVYEVGSVAYWPPGKALCIFFGPTPASHGDEPRMASQGNPVGKIDGEARVLKKVSSSAVVTVERA
ncbi:MAG: hypothetical protein HY678_07755 [Chloroflexi bacterium]|nr:hypothetical protein [Chloroflexota bacterium]